MSDGIHPDIAIPTEDETDSEPSGLSVDLGASHALAHPDLARSRPFNTNRWGEGDRIDALIEAFFGELRATEVARHGNERRMRQHLRVVLLDLYASFLSDPMRFVAYSRNRNQYVRPERYNRLKIAYRPLMRVIDGLIELGYIENHGGFLDRTTGIGRQSRMKATQKLIHVMRLCFGVTPQIISEIPDQELVILRDSEGKEQDYADTAETVRMRSFLRNYNEVLSRAEIGLTCGPTPTRKVGCTSFSLSDRIVRRVFNNGSFEQGGRFYGGWWQATPSAARTRITINGNPTVECDYSAQHIHILYGLEGINYFERFDVGDDSYALPGYEGVDRHILKLVLLISLNVSSRESALKAIRKDLRQNHPDVSLGDLDVGGIINAFAEKHDLIIRYLFGRMGPRIQRIDSSIAERVMAPFVHEGNCILCIHDSFIVEQRYAECLTQRMENAFLEEGNISVPSIVQKS
jgi:hypothetical protein